MIWLCIFQAVLPCSYSFSHRDVQQQHVKHCSLPGNLTSVYFTRPKRASMAAQMHEQTETRGQAGVQRLKADTRRRSPAQPVLLASQERKWLPRSESVPATLYSLQIMHRNQTRALNSGMHSLLQVYCRGEFGRAVSRWPQCSPPSHRYAHWNTAQTICRKFFY